MGPGAGVSAGPYENGVESIEKHRAVQKPWTLRLFGPLILGRINDLGHLGADVVSETINRRG